MTLRDSDTGLVGDDEIDYQAERGPRPPLLDIALVLLTVAVVIVHAKLSDIAAVIAADIFLKVHGQWRPDPTPLPDDE